MTTSPPSPDVSQGNRAPGVTAPTPPIQRLLDIEALATWLDIPARTVRYFVAERRIPFVRIGRHIRFDPAEIRRWIDQGRVDPVERHGRRTRR